MVPSDAVGVGAARPDAAAIARRRGCRRAPHAGGGASRDQNQIKDADNSWQLLTMMLSGVGAPTHGSV